MCWASSGVYPVAPRHRTTDRPSSNQIDTAPVVLGALWASATVTPANPTYTVDELTFQLKDSGAIALATLAEFLPVAAKAAANAGIPKDRIILIGDTRVEGYYHWTQIHDPTTFKYRKGKFDVHKNLSFLVYSSGTTGHPKGVMLSHSNVASDILMLMVGEGGNLHWSRDSTVAFLPFFHIYGLVCGFSENVGVWAWLMRYRLAIAQYLCRTQGDRHG